MVATATINGQDGSNWLVTLPDGVTLSQAGVTNGPFFLDAAHPVLNINYNYDLAALFDPALTHGITSIELFDLDGGGQSDNTGNGLRGQIAINFINDLGVPLGKPTGTPFFIYLADTQSDAENNPVHPFYAHFHGVATTYGSLTATPGTFSGSGTPGAPSTINLTGIIAAGTTASIGPITIHERDQANSDDSFSLNFFPTADTIGSSDRAVLKAQWDALQSTTAFRIPIDARIAVAGDDATSGDALGITQDAFFFDTAVVPSLGNDKILNFGLNDFIVTTSLLYDSNRDDIITFGRNGKLDLAGATGNSPVNPHDNGGTGQVEFLDTNGQPITKLHYDGTLLHDGVQYYIYSQIGSGVTTGDVSFA